MRKRCRHQWALLSVQEVPTGKGTSASVTERCLLCRNKRFYRRNSGLLLETIRYRRER
jgi:hypothetical protein